MISAFVALGSLIHLTLFCVGHESFVLIIVNMKIILCPNSRHGEVKILYDVNYELPENNLMLAVRR